MGLTPGTLLGRGFSPLALLGGHGLQPADALLDGRMGHEHAGHAAAMQRVDDEERSRCWMSFGGRVVDDTRALFQLAERACQPQRMAGEQRALAIRLVFTGTA